MKKMNKGSNAKRTPSIKYLSPVASSKVNQRYENLSFEVQFQRLDILFSKGCFTMKTASVLLEIDRANICRYIADRKESNKIYFVKYGVCPISKHPRVGFYTANSELYYSHKNSSNGKV